MVRSYAIMAIFTFVLVSLSAQPVRFVVDRNGEGDFRTIQEAVYAVRDFKPGERAHIYVKDGVYNEKLVIPTYKCNIILEGESVEGTQVVCNDYAALNGMGTFRTYTMLVAGNDIEIMNLTVSNTAGRVGQAVAIHVEGDRVVFHNCRFLGNQDTVFLGREGARQRFVNCYIEGTTDFIFGPSSALFENCTIHCKANSYITAASTPKQIQIGLVFDNCRITTSEDVTAVYLGRPWREYAMTLFMNCELPAGIRPEGWHNWSNPDNEYTARYAEYHNRGAGADTSQRVGWARSYFAQDVLAFDMGDYFDF